MTYIRHYDEISRWIPICDQQYNTQKPEPEIGTNGSRQTEELLRVDRSGSGSGPPRSCWSVFWTGLEPSWPVFAVRTWAAGSLPWPVADTTYNLPNHRLKVRIIITSKNNPVFTRLACSGTGWIAFPCGLQPDQIYSMWMSSNSNTLTHREINENTNWIHPCQKQFKYQ